MGKAKVLVIRDYLCGVYENEVDLIENTYGGVLYQFTRMPSALLGEYRK